MDQGFSVIILVMGGSDCMAAKVCCDASQGLVAEMSSRRFDRELPLRRMLSDVNSEAHGLDTQKRSLVLYERLVSIRSIAAKLMIHMANQ